MRILALNWRDIESPWAGGAEVQIHAVLERLAARGHEVLLLASRFPACAAETEIRGVRVRRRGEWWNANFALQAAARRELHAGNWDVVLEDVNKIPFYTPLVHRLPVVVLVPHLFGGTIFRETNPFFGAYIWLMEQGLPRVYRRAHFMPVSASTQRDLVRRGVPAARTVVVHNGIDFDRYELPAPPPRADRPTLLHLGRLMRYKSADVALYVLARIRARLPQARLWMAGDGPDLPRLQRLARALQLEGSVEFLGHVPHAEKVRRLWQCHVVLNPSPKEGWGLTVLEANACGVPVVASRVPGLIDSVRDGETGILVPYGDADEFARAALGLLQEPDRRERLGAEARAWARRFTWEEAAVQTEAVLLGAIAPAAGASRDARSAPAGLPAPGAETRMP